MAPSRGDTGVVAALGIPGQEPCRPGLCCFWHHSCLPVDVLLVMLQWIFSKSNIIVI